MKTMPYWTRTHIFLLLFAAFYTVHILSINSVSGEKYLGYTFTYGAAVIFAYILARWAIEAKFRTAADIVSHRTRIFQAQPFLLAGDLIVIVFPIAYFAMAGWVPAWTMLFSSDYYANSGLRHDFYGELPTPLKYAGEYFLRGLAPFWLLFSYITRRRLFLLTLVSGSLFAFAVVTKSNIVIMLVPLLVYQVVNRKFLDALGIAAVVAIVLISNVVLQDKALIEPAEISAPGVAASPTQIPTPLDTPSGLQVPPEVAQPQPEVAQPTVQEKIGGLVLGTLRTIEGLAARLFYVNGLVVTQWMDSYTTDFPFENGCGYAWFAALANCDFVNVPYKIWLKYYPNLHERGLVGSVTSANYVNGFANFGTAGVIASGLGIGVILIFLNALFPSRSLGVALSATPLALTFESPLSTLLHSGGWGLTIVLALVFLYDSSNTT